MKANFTEFVEDFGAHVPKGLSLPHAYLHTVLPWFDTHFLPQTSFCGVDDGMRFDFVGGLEGLEQWGPALIKYLGLIIRTHWKSLSS